MGKIKKFEVKRDLCIGAASCIVVTPSVYELDQENKAVIKQKNNVKNSGPADVKNLEDTGIDEKKLMEAAEVCPTKAIYLYDEGGKQVYP